MTFSSSANSSFTKGCYPYHCQTRVLIGKTQVERGASQNFVHAAPFRTSCVQRSAEVCRNAFATCLFNPSVALYRLLPTGSSARIAFMRSQKVDQGAARAMNRRLILDELRRSGPLSRTRIAAQTKLSPASITIVTSALLAEGLLIEHPELASQLPRNPVPLGINYRGHQAIGMKLLDTELQAVLTDLALDIVAQTKVTLDSSHPEAVVEAAAQAQAQLGETQDGLTHLIGVGLGLSGLIDSENGVCAESHRTDWHNVPLGALLQDRLGVHVWIDNDVNAFATAERLVGRGRQTTNFAVATLGRGIGAALVLGGQLFRGTRGGAGEFGHTLSERDGRLCECGMQGCLEAYTSSPNLITRFNEQNPDTLVARAEDLTDLAARGDERARALLEDAGRRLGEGLADLANLFDPDLVILGGEGVAVGEPMLGPLQRAFHRRRLLKTTPIDFLIDAWGDDAWARGAAGLVVEHFFDGLALEQGHTELLKQTP